jgi:hypothetical protein
MLYPYLNFSVISFGRISSFDGIRQSINELLHTTHKFNNKILVILPSSDISFINYMGEELDLTEYEYAYIRWSFQQYIDCLTTKKNLPTDNIYSNLKKEYHEAFVNEYGDGVSFDVDQFIQLYMSELSLIYPEKEFIFCAIPTRPFNCLLLLPIITHKALKKELYVLDWDVIDEKETSHLMRVNTEYVDESLNLLLEYNFENEKDILIIFIYDGYNYTHEQVFQGESLWRSYDKMRYNLREHMVETLPDIFKDEKQDPNAESCYYMHVEMDWEVGRLWRTQPIIGFKFDRARYECFSS